MRCSERQHRLHDDYFTHFSVRFDFSLQAPELQMSQEDGKETEKATK